MFKNYFKIAWRNLVKNKISSIINIGGLAIGMTAAILISLWVWDELSYDKYHTQYDRVGRVLQHSLSNGIVGTGAPIPILLGKELKNNYGDNFKHVALASWEGDHILTFGDKHLSQTGIYMDKDGPKMFSLKMLQGAVSGLSDPTSIFLSASAAKAVFGKEDPLNKLMKIDNKLNVKVTGVYEDLPNNTSLNNVHFIAPWDLYITSEPWLKSAETEWQNNSFQLFVQIADNTDFASVNKKIINAKLNNLPAEEKKYRETVFVHPMKDWHLRANWTKNGIHKGGLIEYVWLFAIIGAFVLLLACINFMNLSTARSEKRAKEVGIRKTVGSMRKQLIGQFLCESFMVTILGFALAILFTFLALPAFNKIANKAILFPFANAVFWLCCIGFVLITGLIAGSYPAFYLSSFRPVKVLKGTFKAGRMASLPRKVLVVIQFTISVVLIIGTIVVYKQIQHSKNRPIGYNRDGLVMIEMKSPEFYGKFDVLRTALKDKGAITEMAESSSPLTAVWSTTSNFTWDAKDPNLDVDFATVWVTHEFGKMIDWQIKDGRDFSRQFATDSSAIVINEAAVKFMGLKNPVGTIISQTDGSLEKIVKNYHIVGVIKDMLMESPYSPVKQTLYRLNYENVSWINCKLNPNKSASESLTIIEKVFKQVIPSAPFDYKFADIEYAAKFAAVERIGKLAVLFTILAIFISCLGLFGLASFVAEQRTKEIGIRKIVGASVFNLWRLLSKDFAILIFISCFIAMPIAYYFLHNWLQKYEYRTTISAWIFAAALTGALVITLVTVSFQAIKAAVSNPVKSLRSE